MNLILSDVEETIMLVDGPDGAPPGQGVVNVRDRHRPILLPSFILTEHPGGKKEDGNAFRKRRWSYSGTYTLLSRVSVSPLLAILGITSVADVTFIKLPVAHGVVQFCASLDPISAEM
jgi:hypothetical protein